MSTTLALGPDWLNPDRMITNLLASMGLWVVLIVLLIIFAECGLLLGFFLPGDSLLFTVGMFIASGKLDFSLTAICVMLAIAAFLGNMTGYYIGRAAGPPLFERSDSRLFRKEHVVRTHAFFDKYGGRAIVLARFVPIVRTFITAMAGVGKMNVKFYTLYSAIGAVLWACGVTVLGYFLGQIHFVEKNIEIIFLLIVLVSVLPLLFELLKKRKMGTPDIDGHPRQNV